jgi:hypothetical protein
MMIGLELVSLYSFQCENMGIWLMIAMLHSVANLATIINELGLFFTGLITNVYLSSSESCDQVFFQYLPPQSDPPHQMDHPQRISFSTVVSCWVWKGLHYASLKKHTCRVHAIFIGSTPTVVLLGCITYNA